MRVDSREAGTASAGRLVDPFQGVAVHVMEQNAASGQPRNGDGRLSFQPQDGIYITAHCMKCITDYQLVISLSLEYPEAIAAGTWSTALEEGLQHEAFQPLALPAIRVGGPAMLDFKVKYNGHLLMHVAGTGYSGDRALSLEVYRVYEDVFSDLCPGRWTRPRSRSKWWR